MATPPIWKGERLPFGAFGASRELSWRCLSRPIQLHESVLNAPSRCGCLAKRDCAPKHFRRSSDWRSTIPILIPDYSRFSRMQEWHLSNARFSLSTMSLKNRTPWHRPWKWNWCWPYGHRTHAWDHPAPIPINVASTAQRDWRSDAQLLCCRLLFVRRDKPACWCVQRRLAYSVGGNPTWAKVRSPV